MSSPGVGDYPAGIQRVVALYILSSCPRHTAYWTTGVGPCPICNPLSVSSPMSPETGVRHGRRLLGEVRRFQLRRAGAGGRQRQEEPGHIYGSGEQESLLRQAWRLWREGDALDRWCSWTRAPVAIFI
jgi:hypothetical protein